MMIFRLSSREIKKRENRAAVLISVFMAPALFYTYKIDKLDQMGELSSDSVPLLAPLDALWIFLLFLLSSLILSQLFTYWPRRSNHKGEAVSRRSMLFVFLACIVIWLPFLFTFYPAPGMNDTVFMMNHPYRGMAQFPWAYSLLYGTMASWSRQAFGTAEPAIFLLSLCQMVIFSAILTGCVFYVYKRNCRKQDFIILSLYIAFFPMIGNYAIAAVRDGLYSAGLFLSFCLLLRALDEKEVIHERAFSAVLFISALLLMLFRNNGFLPALFMVIALQVLHRGSIRNIVLLLLAVIIAYGPGQYFLHERGETPLFQEKIAIPLQQMGRVIALDGSMDDETRELNSHLLPLKQWKEHYSPYTVDFIKWDDYFDHDYLNQHSKDWMHAWARTGFQNPRLYMEGWMTETYALWNLDPLEWNVQSRFGYALTEDNMKHMMPSSNDQMAVGNGPFPASVKAVLENYMWEGSRFLGAGFSLWISILCAGFFYVQRRSRYILALLPLWGNTLTLLLATPASSVFRYSFGFVLVLPVLIIVVSETTPEKETLEPGNAEGLKQRRF